MKVELISITQPKVSGISSAEELIAYAARVSNPENQMNTETAPKLLKYLIKHKHWSPFEMVNMCVSIETTRAIAAQILRHRSFSFQEFSQRYSAVASCSEYPELRMKAKTNRQSSTDKAEEMYNYAIERSVNDCFELYNELVDSGIATETARMILPLCTPTTLYMNGTIRSWIHYLQLRCDPHTQLEHREIALGIRDILENKFPTVFGAVFETSNEE